MGHLPSDKCKVISLALMLGGFDAYPQARLCWWCRIGDMRSSHRSGGEPDANPGAHRSDAACPRGHRGQKGRFWGSRITFPQPPSWPQAMRWAGG
jgi:hypothetical protein